MLNSEFMADQAAKLVERLEKETLQSDAHRIVRAYELLLNRAPTKAEKKLARQFLKEQASAYKLAKATKDSSPEREALVDFCLVLFNSAEFLYVN